MGSINAEHLTMPLFSSKFSPKRAPYRRKDANISKEATEELVSDQRNVHLKLGDQQYIFECGDWIPGNFRIMYLKM